MRFKMASKERGTRYGKTMSEIFELRSHKNKKKEEIEKTLTKMKTGFKKKNSVKM